jgi:hypothetical protein
MRAVCDIGNKRPNDSVAGNAAVHPELPPPRCCRNSLAKNMDSGEAFFVSAADVAYAPPCSRGQRNLPEHLFHE